MNLLIDHWSYDPFLIWILFVAGVHVSGLRRLWLRTAPERRDLLKRRAIRFYAGLLVLLITVESPIDYWANSYFFVHMFQHVLLMFVAPPLIVAGAPWQPLMFGVPLSWRRTVIPHVLRDGWSRPLRWLGRVLINPVVAVVLFNGVMIAWSVPVLLDLAERNQTVHIWLMHGSMFATGMLFWLQIIQSPPVHTRITLAGQAVALFTTSIVMWVLAMGMSLLSQHSWYSVYDHIHGVTLSAFNDQQIAAGILWVCGDLWAIPALTGVMKRLITQDGNVDSAIHSILGAGSRSRYHWSSPAERK